MTDVVEALRAVLLADSNLAELVSIRIFDTELPVSNDLSMPEKCVVIRAAGGANTFGRGTLQLNDGRVNFISYGETPHLAATVDGAVFSVLKPMTARVSFKTYLHWAKQIAGPIPLRDPDYQWPYVTSSWQILASDITVG